jgi:hypothetical protein
MDSSRHSGQGAKRLDPESILKLKRLKMDPGVRQDDGVCSGKRRRMLVPPKSN